MPRRCVCRCQYRHMQSVVYWHQQIDSTASSTDALIDAASPPVIKAFRPSSDGWWISASGRFDRCCVMGRASWAQEEAPSRLSTVFSSWDVSTGVVVVPYEHRQQVYYAAQKHASLSTQQQLWLSIWTQPWRKFSQYFVTQAVISKLPDHRHCGWLELIDSVYIT